MRFSSLRALLIALALVVQTIAGGAAVARAANGQGVGTFHHCQTLDATAKDHGDAGRSTDGTHRCHDCCLSGQAFSLAAAENVFSPTHRVAIIVAAERGDDSGVPARHAQSRFARGPPPAL
jgi:hypothetical protein